MYVYAALGDSITYGQNASSIGKTFPYRLTSMMRAKGVEARRMVLARPGWTSADLAEAIHADPYPLRFAAAATVWIGGDDLIHAALQMLQGSGGSVDGMLRQYQRMLGLILKSVRSLGVADVICCTQYNPFPNSPIAVQGIQLLNQAILRTASGAGCRVARADQWFAGNESRLIDGYRSGDLQEVNRGSQAVHPNDSGHSVIASGLFPFLYSVRKR
ncbi:SGNH/GDSL hydrolase family protein [Paenibacillus filicis]|uniref:SGNH/GDSL hydrolase family protein n=1 Tax=Paenibacillus gyeongsangnamensis TaxID=3388067 RepID=A0ABT4QHI6_9BACL|nr:SGNH/GDSL hydrolase family protein [Paenibacillus filicis]MCZ8516338.1 SGNH/GDSL hydrolase family protein [Paenibacillus filicis]